MSAEDRDQLFEKALARQLRAGKDAPAAACPDAETLAAYYERLLSVEELSAAKTHLVSCTRCQEILAQLEATQDLVESQDRQKASSVLRSQALPGRSEGSELPSAAVTPLAEAQKTPSKVAPLVGKKRATLRWAAPAGAIAAVLFLWVGMREFRTAQRAPGAATQIAENRKTEYRPAPAQPAAPSSADRPSENRKEASPNSELDEKSSAGLPRNSLRIESQNAPAIQSPSARPRTDSVVHGETGFGSGASLGMVAKSKQAENVPPAKKADQSDSTNGGAMGGVVGGRLAKKDAAPAPPKANKAEAKSLQDRDKFADSAGKADIAVDASPSPVAAPPAPPPPPARAKARASTQASGQLRGTVTDPSGAAVSGAIVALKSPNGRTLTQTSTDNTGNYTFDGVAAGNYQLELQSPGFKTDAINGLNIAAGDNVQNAQLQVGASAETVEVTAQAVQPNTQAAALDTRTAEVSSVPLNGRNVQALMLLSAGLQTVTSPDSKAVWKFGDAGQIVYSKNAGKDWTSQPSGVSAKLLAASAPSAKICWIAGAAGTLLRTTDKGSHWNRIMIPIAGDLGGVRATDDKNAIIWDATNQLRYQTFDGGATWQPTPNQ